MDYNTNRKPGRDYTVELWRFIFCMVVLGFHFFVKTKYDFLSAGYLAVEFFFLVSGYGIYAYYVKQLQGRSLKDKIYAFGMYIGKRLLKLYPLYLLSLLCMLAFYVISKGWNFSQTVSYLSRGWAEFFLLQCSPGGGGAALILPNWYVAALFWGSAILLLGLLFTGKFGGCVICPVVSFLIYRYYFYQAGKIDVIYSYHAIARALAGLALGVCIGFVSQLLWDKWFAGEGKEEITSGKRKTRLRYGLYALSNLILAGILVYTGYGRRSRVDFLVIVLYAVSLLFLFSVRIDPGKKKKALFSRLSGVTYPVYLFQMPVIEMLFWIFAVILK